MSLYPQYPADRVVEVAFRNMSERSSSMMAPVIARLVEALNQYPPSDVDTELLLPSAYGTVITNMLDALTELVDAEIPHEGVMRIASTSSLPPEVWSRILSDVTRPRSIYSLPQFVSTVRLVSREWDASARAAAHLRGTLRLHTGLRMYQVVEWLQGIGLRPWTLNIMPGGSPAYWNRLRQMVLASIIRARASSMDSLHFSLAVEGGWQHLCKALFPQEQPSQRAASADLFDDTITSGLRSMTIADDSFLNLVLDRGTRLCSKVTHLTISAILDLEQGDLWRLLCRVADVFISLQVLVVRFSDRGRRERLSDTVSCPAVPIHFRNLRVLSVAPMWPGSATCYVDPIPSTSVFFGSLVTPVLAELELLDLYWSTVDISDVMQKIQAPVLRSVNLVQRRSHDNGPPSHTRMTKGQAELVAHRVLARLRVMDLVDLRIASVVCGRRVLDVLAGLPMLSILAVGSPSRQDINIVLQGLSKCSTSGWICARLTHIEVSPIAVPWRLLHLVRVRCIASRAAATSRIVRLVVDRMYLHSVPALDTRAWSALFAQVDTTLTHLRLKPRTFGNARNRVQSGWGWLDPGVLDADWVDNHWYDSEESCSVDHHHCPARFDDVL